MAGPSRNENESDAIDDLQLKILETNIMTGEIKRSKSLLAIPSNANLILSDNSEFEALKPKKPEVFIGNLKYKIATKCIICKLQDLFLKKVFLSVPIHRFTVYLRKSKQNPKKYAFVILNNEMEERLLCQVLDKMEGLDFVVNGLKLQVQKKLSDTLKITRNIKILFDGKRNNLVKSQSVPELCSIEKRVGNNIDSSIGNINSLKKGLYLGQHLPVEDRVTEYKRGSGKYIKNVLVSHIRKYVCAFLNSEGGRLMIGIADDCKVYGIVCNRKQEDQARCQIDNVIKKFNPHVPTKCYGIDFIPVSRQDVEFTSMEPFLKVLEVSVIKPFKNSLYENDRGEIFVRRDGSIEGPLKNSQIIEWCRINFSSSNKNCRNKLSETKNFENVILAKESYGTIMAMERIEESINESHKRIEEHINHLLSEFKVKEEILKTELELSKLNLSKANSELQKTNKNEKWSATCIIL